MQATTTTTTTSNDSNAMLVRNVVPPARPRPGRGRRAKAPRRVGGSPTAPRNVNQPMQWKKYHAILLELMDHVDGRAITDGEVPVDNRYHKDKIFTPEELSHLTPDHIYRFFAKKVYGREDPGVDDNPTEGRSTTLCYYKKAISFFMPNKLSKWTVIAGVASGNPTKSQEINDLIAAVIRKETRGIGVVPSMDRPLTKNEFHQALALIARNGNLIGRLRCLAMIKFQFHLICRNDDTAHVTKDTLKRSPQFPQFLTVKMKWSKNVREERDCPNQIILASMDYTSCAVLGLALFLEKWSKDTTTTGASSQWLFVEGSTDRTSELAAAEKEIMKGKNQYAAFLKKHVFEKKCLIIKLRSNINLSVFRL